MLTKTKTLIDKYTDALVVTGLLLVIGITLSGNLSLSFGKDKKTVEAAPATVVTNAASAVTTSSANLSGNITASDSTITARGFEWGTDTSYGNTVSSNNPSTSAVLQTQWGSAGSGNGQFNNPYGVAVSPGGNVYVTDRNNNRVQVFDSNGNYLNKWGSAGAGNGQFNGPHGIVVDSIGNVFVADTFNHRVQKFDSSGAYLGQFGGFGSGNGQFNTLYGLAKDASGNIYVADTGNQRIQKFNNSGVYQSQFGSAGSGNGQFSNPTNLAIASGGNIYVADNLNNRVQVFNSSGVYQSQFGSYPSMYSPNGIAINSNGFVYVEDTGNSYVRVYNSSNVLQTSFSVNNPPGIATDSTNHLYITSYAGNKVLKYLSEQYYSTGTYQLVISGLTCDATYHYRAYATNADGTSYGEDQTFSVPCMYIVSDDVQRDGNNWSSLILTGEIFTSSSAITARGFQWGTDTSYGNALYDTGTSPFPLGLYSISSALFDCDTTYHMRAYATNSQGTYYGNDYEFNFICMYLQNNGADSLTDTTANLKGNIGSSNGDVTARGFEYGLDTSYGTTITDSAPPPYSTLPLDYSLIASNLACNTTYHFRPYATNSHGTFYGDDDTFTTLGCTTVNTLPASGVGATSALLNGNVTETLSAIIGQGFQLGTSTSYGTNIAYTPSATNLAYKYKWGSYGSGNGEFDQNTGIAKDNSGNIYVADFQNNRIQKFDPSGNYLGQFGSYGSGDGQFNYPIDLVIGNSGNIYVVDRNNNRIQIFDTAFNYLGKFGSFGSGIGEFDYPWGITTDSSGNLYVADYANNRIQKFDPSGNYLGQFGSYGSGDGQFNYPIDLVIGNSGNIYVSDLSNYRIQIFDSSFNYLSQFGSYGTGDGQFSGAYALTIDKTGKLYVTDEGPSVGRVQIFDSSGNYLSQFGSYGTGDGQFIYAEGIITDNSGNIFVSSWGDSSERVQVFGPVPVYSTGPYSTQSSGLTCGTTYHYRAYVTNAGGTYYGADQTFNTQGCTYVPSASKPTTTVSPNPAPLLDLSVLTAIGRSAFLKQSPGGWLGYIYRFIQSLPHNLTVLLPYLVLIFILVVALIYAVEATRERILAILYTRKARHKASALIAEKGVLTNISNSSKLIADQISNQTKLLVGAGLLNKFEQSAINDSTKQIIKQSQVFGWSESSRELAGRQSLHRGGWAKIAHGLVHPLLWAPVLILALVTVGLDLLYRNYGISEVSSADIRLQIIILAMCSVVLALVWARLIYNRNTRQNASVELSRAILLMQANAGILDESVEKNEMLIDEINSITKKLTRKDEADEFIKARDELASILESLAVIKALNLQAAGLSTSQSITKSINDVLKENKQLIARKKIKTNKNIQPGLKIGLPAALSYRLIETNLRNAFKLTDKGSAIDVSLKSVGQKAILKIEYKGLALSRRMLHLLEGPIENYRALDATGTALFVNKIIAESIGGQFDVVSDSKYGTTVRIKFSKSNAKIDKFKPVNKELDNPELAPFNGKAKPA